MRLFLFVCLLMTMVFNPNSSASAPPDPYAAQWKKIDALLSKSQTTTAAPLVEAIYQSARQAQHTPAYVRSLLYKIRLLQAREEDETEKAIALLETELKTATFPARPIVHSLLAELYTTYLNANRYRLYERTAGASATTGPTAGADAGTGLATWDMGKLGAAIVRHYYESVEDEPLRQLNTSLAALGDLAGGGDAEGRALRPTLYDLLAHRAIEGLQNQELYVTRPEQQFQLTEPKLFGTAAEFAALRLMAPGADSLNGQLHALRLLQRLTASRQQLVPANRAALADVDLQRVDYLRALTQNTDLVDDYERALVRLAAAYQNLPISAEFIVRRAELQRETDPVAAVALTREAEARFSKSHGAARARQLRAEIERPELEFSGSEIVVPNQAWRLDVKARNVTALHAWAYRISLKEWASLKRTSYGDEDGFLRINARRLKSKAVATWTIPVAPTSDYKEQKLATAGPKLPVGYYLVIISNQKSKSLAQRKGLVTSHAVLGASQLSALSHYEPITGKPQLLVLERQTGQPLAGVSAQASYQYYDVKARNNVIRKSEVRLTNAMGIVELPAANVTGQLSEDVIATRIWRGADTLRKAPIGDYYGRSDDDNEDAQRRTFLFTDRAIYRPGQTLYFKGILTETRGQRSRPATSQLVSLRLVDVNGQTVQTLPFTTSEFGSFHGSLVLPTGLLNGEMRLQTDHGSLTFAVEDYKRPTFYVQLDSVPGRPQLGRPLTVGGQARAYSGQATDGASVSYRVTRRELWPLFHFDGDYGRRGSQEIAHGTTTTDAGGRFSLTFTPPLVPNVPGPPRGWEPGYLFEITADVTDAAGETRTGTRAFPIGRNPLSLLLTGPGLVDKRRVFAFTLVTKNATEELLPASGTLRLFARQSRPVVPGVPAPRPIEDESRNTETPEPAPRLVKTLDFDTKTSSEINLEAVLAELPSGRYRLEAQAISPDTARDYLNFVLFDSESATIPFDTPNWFVAHGDTTNPNKAYILVGSRDADARILLETERGGKLLRREWLTLRANEQRRIMLDTGTVAATGPLHVHTTQVRDNELYRNEAQFETVPRPQPLRLSIATFRNKLLPGQQETWRVTIHQANGQPAVAELLATLYDQSLDIFRLHSFMGLELGSEYYPARFEWQGEFGKLSSAQLFDIETSDDAPSVRYPVLRTWENHLVIPDQDELRDKVVSRMTVQGNSNAGASAGNAEMTTVKFTPPVIKKDEETLGAYASVAADATTIRNPRQSGATPNLTIIPTRTDFRETAFWQPALRTDKNGDIVLEFQMPEAVTRWQLLALAHDKDLHTGQLARQLVTQKEIQITPNAPRFFRQGDTFTFSAKFSNLTTQKVSGTAQLFLLDAATGQDITSQLLKGNAQQPAVAAANQSAALGWEISLPTDFAPAAVTYRVVAEANSSINNEQRAIKKPRRRKAKLDYTLRVDGADYSDGEENTLAVLPNRVLVTERLPLPIVGPGARTFELSKLTSSATRRNHSLTLEITANPAWYAVQSLPYLMEYPYECSEQIFSRLYANLLAAQILKSNPRFKTMLAEWARQAQSGTAAQKKNLASKLAQNEDLKNLLLQETPWVRDAQGETERLARLTELFDATRMQGEINRALLKLQSMQLAGGGFPWFEKMPEDRYITQLIVAGFGKLKKLGAFNASADPVGRQVLQEALQYLDSSLASDYATLQKQKNVKLADNNLHDLHIQALYARSFWPHLAEAPTSKTAHTYYRGQVAKYWPGQTRYLQAQAALVLSRYYERVGGVDKNVAALIMTGLSENALHSSELGMYWKEVRGGYYWREAPTETQATLIEAFDEINNDRKAVDEMKLWLLTQKHTHHWESTRATADACYALLLRSSDWLVPTQPLLVAVGGQPVKPEAAQAGTGYFKTSWLAAEVLPAQGRVSITKPDAGVAWGALYWQYFEELDKLTPAATPLSLERQLYRETRTAGGPVLEKVTAATPLKVGEALVVRLVLRTDRALEYVHLKDQRAAGLEPIAQTSGYRYQNGLSYYESPRDAATNFFLGAVPRGTHVFEYRLRAAQAGDFSGGLSEVQCLYAPEFRAHSKGLRLRMAP
ncbi:alpha-2-macroglobulin family protein [Hymenobacter sp. B1770]|uniref:alpha-2-macroglobulin family protein n=1 Tax=Hymenobacter sp. B1770 TaxID=1718788 RepID=UPI003CF51E1B